MIAKKISRVWCIIIVFCLWGAPVASTVMVQSDQNNALGLDDAIVGEDEEEIIVTGEVSCGDNAITGRACIVVNRKQLSKVRKGDIVIAPAINSFWYSTLSMAAGIITEKGDGSSLAILLGKKLGIPVIVGAKGATKKIVDGQIITCDPVTKNIYHVAYPTPTDVHFDVLIMPQKDNGHQVIHDKLGKSSVAHAISGKVDFYSGMTMDYLPQHQNTVSPVVATVQHSRFKPISVQRILADENDIREYIKATESNVSLGQTFGKKAAAWVKGIASKTFDAMPVEFFKDQQNKEQSIKQLRTQPAAEYIDQGKKEFVGRYLCSSTADLKINTIAEFLHDRMVDHLNVPDECKKLLKEQPLRINAFLKDTNVKDWYMHLTCQNIIIQYYVEKEFGRKAT